MKVLGPSYVVFLIILKFLNEGTENTDGDRGTNFGHDRQCVDVWLSQGCPSSQKYDHFDPSSHANQPSVTESAWLSKFYQWPHTRVGEAAHISPYLQTVLAAMEKKNQFSLIWLSRVALSVTLNVHTTVSKEFSSLLREQGRVWHLWHIKERASKGVS